MDVLLPNYNKVDYIEECLRSLLSQTYPNWRCIVVDGYSDDGSWEMIKQLARPRSKFDLYQLERIGLYESWNFGLEKVKNPLFAVLTSDDVWESDWLEKAVGGLRTHPEAVCVAARTCRITADSVFDSVAPVTEIGERLFDCYDSRSRPRPGPLSSMACYFSGPIYTSMHSIVHRASVLDYMRFATDVGTIADREWYMRLGLYGDIVYLQDSNAYLRSYPGQLTKKSYKARAEVGEMVRTINSRNRSEIAAKLGRAREVFWEASERYENHYLEYFYQRPSLVEARLNPVQSVLKVGRLALQYPALSAREFAAYFLSGKKLLDEKRLAMAERVKSAYAEK